MLKKIDRYIIKKYLATFFFTVLIFTLIAVIIDISDKVEDFIEEPITVWQIFTEYYIPYIPYINGLLLPFYALLAVIFFTSRLASNSEIISMLNAGMSYRRLMYPYLVAALFIFSLHMIANHYVIPRGNQSRLDFEHTYVWKHSDKGKTSNVHIFIGPETKVYIKYYKKRDTLAKGFRMERIVDNKLVSVLKSKTAEWKGPPNKWQLKNYEIRSFNGQAESLLIGEGETIDTTINLTPEDFVRYLNQKEMMDTPELMSYIDTQKSRGLGHTKEFEAELHRRTSDPFTILILTFMGMAIASRKVRGGIGLHIAVGLSVGALFVAIGKFSLTFAVNGSLNPFLGVWIPNILFSFVALYLLSKAQK